MTQSPQPEKENAKAGADTPTPDLAAEVGLTPMERFRFLTRKLLAVEKDDMISAGKKSSE